MKDKFKLVGTKIQEFELPNTDGDVINIKDFQNKQNIIVILLRSIY
ncbi:MAG: hypothetical protein JXA99_13555 [Candidatus Lokiarchaeota archaeon]|nr:hypothetical protein [Candidatus Lokiarchaeota archaeon]